MMNSPRLPLHHPLKVLYIGYVWPEPYSSAAGIRTLQLLSALVREGHQVELGSASLQNKAYLSLKEQGWSCHPLTLNSSGFDHWIQSQNYNVVLFDRFVTEEQYGSRVRQALPHCTQIIDTQDTHWVRRLRSAHPSWLCGDLQNSLDALKRCAPGNPSQELEWVLREAASYLRADGVIFISNADLEWAAQISPSLLEMSFVYPLGASSPPRDAPWENRSGFLWLGNFRHSPNLQSLLLLTQVLWPQLKKLLPQATLTVFGAYPSQQAADACRSKPGIKWGGPIEDHQTPLLKSRVLLAPLTSGAGLKGKIAEAWTAGCAVATSPIGLEGYSLHPDADALGFRSESDFIQGAVSLHESHEAWSRNVEQGRALLHQRGASHEQIQLSSSPSVVSWIEDRYETMIQTGSSWMSKLLLQQSLRSSAYFTRWLEAKSQLSSLQSQTNPNADEGSS